MEKNYLLQDKYSISTLNPYLKICNWQRLIFLKTGLTSCSAFNLYESPYFCITFFGREIFMIWLSVVVVTFGPSVIGLHACLCLENVLSFSRNKYTV